MKPNCVKRLNWRWQIWIVLTGHVGYAHKGGVAKGEIEFRFWFCSYFKLKCKIAVKANGKHSVERLTK